MNQGRDDFSELEAMFGRPRPDARTGAQPLGPPPVTTPQITEADVASARKRRVRRRIVFGRPRPDARTGAQPLGPPPVSTPQITEADVASARKRRVRRRIVAGAIALVVVAIVATYIPVTLLAPVPAPTVALTTPTVAAPTAAKLELPPAIESAVSITGGDDFEAMTGKKEMTGSSGGDAALPIASISKLITALVVLDAKPVDENSDGPTLTFSKADHDLYDKYYVLQASVQPMKTGSQMSERNVIRAMLIASACNYADALSTWAFGSNDAFIAATRKWLTANGLSNTKMVEPTGINARNVSTPADLVALGKIAKANPLIATIVASPTLNVPDLENRGNNNDLLGIDGVDGIKTGTLDGAGSNLLFSASVDLGLHAPVTMIGAVLNAASREEVDSSVRQLVRSLKGGFHEVDLIAADKVVGTYTTAWGDTAKVRTSQAVSLYTWSDQAITAEIHSTPVKSGHTNTMVGEIEFASPTNKAQVPLLLEGTIEPPDAWWKLTHPQRMFGK